MESRPPEEPEEFEKPKRKRPGVLVPTGAILALGTTAFWHHDTKIEDVGKAIELREREEAAERKSIVERLSRLEGLLLHLDKIDPLSRREFEATSAQTKQALDSIISRLDRMDRK